MSKHIFKGQGYLRLEFDTKNTDIASASAAIIRYIKPKSKTRGEWTGTIVGTLVTYQLDNSSIDESGDWTFEPVLTIGGLNAPCEIVKINFKTAL